MEKFWYSSRSYVGLILLILVCFFSSTSHARVVWQSTESRDFSFDQYDSLFFFISLPKYISNQDVVNVIKKHIQNKEEINKVDLKNLDEVLEAIGKTHMLFHILLQQTEESDLHILQVYVTTPARAMYNQAAFSSSPWRREFLLKTSEDVSHDIQQALKESLGEFFTQYYQTNPKIKGKAKFYIPVIKD